MGAVIAKCALCPQTAGSVRLYGPVELPDGMEGMVCNHHMYHPEDKVERSVAPEKVKAKEDKSMAKALTAWFNEKIANAPEKCENSGERLVIPNLNPRCVVCHIVPKAKVKSVATDENNYWYGNVDHHNKYDKNYKTSAADMPVARICIERFAMFRHKIPPHEMKWVAQWLIDGADKLKPKKKQS